MEGVLIYQIALVGVLGVGAQWLAWRLHLPSIVLLAAAGVLAGPVFHLVDPHADFGALFRPIVALAVAVILFEGGLSLRLQELRGAGPAVRRLIVVGIPITWILATAAGRYLAGLSWPVATLFGAILVVTGPTVIVPLIRQAKVAPKIASVLKWEAIVNDPIGAVLAVLVLEVILAHGGDRNAVRPFVQFVLGTAVATGLGVAAGRLLAVAFQRGLVPEFLKAPAILCAVLVCFVAPDAVQPESGLVAAAVFGGALAQTNIASIAEMRRFKEYLTVLLVGGVFVLLTATLQPADVAVLDWRAGLFVAALLLVVRPVAALIALAGTALSWPERALVAWIAPRGVVAVAVTGLFGPTLVARGYPDAAVLTPLAFAVVFATVIAHGFTMRWLARRLGLAAARRNGVLIVGANPWSTALAETLHGEDVLVRIADSAWPHLGAARRTGIPVYFGEILSEPMEHRLDLTAIRYLVAATDNDAYNALVCTSFAHELGRSSLFQLQTSAAGTGDPEDINVTLRGRRLIGSDATFDELLRRVYAGWRFFATRIPEEAGEAPSPPAEPAAAGAALPVLAIRATGEIAFNVPDTGFAPKPGDVLITFAPKDWAPPAAAPAQEQP